jgi:hypothetical protein
MVSNVPYEDGANNRFQFSDGLRPVRRPPCIKLIAAGSPERRPTPAPIFALCALKRVSRGIDQKLFEETPDTFSCCLRAERIELD